MLRHSVLDAMIEQIPSRVAFCRSLESEIFCMHMEDESMYCTRIVNALYDLSLNPKLADQHTAAEFLKLDNAVLSKDSDIYAYRLQRYEDAQQRESTDKDHRRPSRVVDTSKGGVNICGRCRSTNITWTQKQTKGADESMTIFFECSDCGKRWKMS